MYVCQFGDLWLRIGGEHSWNAISNGSCASREGPAQAVEAYQTITVRDVIAKRPLVNRDGLLSLTVG